MKDEFEVVSRPLKHHRYRIESKEPLKCAEAYFAAENESLLQSEDTSFEEPALSEKPKRKFDFFEEEKEGITEKLEAVINADGYYNEILPADYGEETVSVKRKKAPPYVFIIAALMFILAIALIAVNLGKLV